MNYPFESVFWQTHNNLEQKPCLHNQEVDVAIIGGGMAGLSAAQALLKTNKKVAVFEQKYCGAGASGKSSGFITPNAELSCSDFTKRFNQDAAKKIWDLILDGVNNIRTTIKQHAINCDFQEQDTLILANFAKDLKTFQKEHDILTQFEHETTLYNQKEVQELINSKKYFGAIAYPKTFSINTFAYLQSLKQILIDGGIDIYEQTPILTIDGHTLHTPHAKIQAKNIIVCTDYRLDHIASINKDLYHAQTFITLSKPLTLQQTQQIFPQKQYMAWDTDLIYNYFRITTDNRLLLGGGDIFSTYASAQKHDYRRISQKLQNYFIKKFPSITFELEYQWPGLIGISKDIAPMLGRDKKLNHVFYVAACTGLPIAAALGAYAVEHLFQGRNDLDAYFNPYRAFTIPESVQNIIGKQAAFALNNLIKQNIP